MTTHPATPTPGFGFALSRAAHSWHALASESLRPLGIREPQFLILDAIDRAKADGIHPVIQVTAARYADILVMEASKWLRKLEARGLVLRLEHPVDSRAKIVELTPEGLATLAKARKALAGLHATMEESYTFAAKG